MGTEVHRAAGIHHQAVAVRLVYDNNYFNDTYQGIPIGGYNKLVEGLLNGVETMTRRGLPEDELPKNQGWRVDV